MKCYYEELGIERDASDGDIKTAYRKLALRWHPDKNLDCLDEAKERFQLIQQAYEVLSDPQERAWYDNHREQILRGKNSDYQDNSLDLFQYFTVSCFKGYNDDDKGFYAVYGEVFDKIAAEDAEFMDDEEDLLEIPKFGNSKSDYDEVVGPFYAYWSAYSTKKTYEWLCPYDIREIKERRILRAVEKEMKKIVTNAKRERNEEVRNLVAFVRKRDRRVHAHRQFLEEKAEQNRLKQEQIRIEKIRKRHKELEEMKKNTSHIHNDDYEEQLKNLELEYDSDEEEVDEEDDNEIEENSENCDSYEDYIDDLYCVACNKAFKNEKAFANHESSKKHRENIERLKSEMQAEEEEFNASLETDDEDPEIVKVNPQISDELESDLENGFKEVASDDHDQEEEEEIKQSSSNKRKNKKSKKNKKANVTQLAPSEDDKSEHHSEIEEVDLLAQERLKEDDEDEDDWNKTAGKKGNKKNKNKKQAKKTNEPSVKEQPKAPLKPNKAPEPKASDNEAEDAAPNHICVTCKANFPSKNKLFAHLKSTNHGVYIPKTASAPEPVKSKKSNSKRR